MQNSSKKSNPLSEEERAKMIEDIKVSLKKKKLSKFDRVWLPRLLDILEGRGFPFQKRP